jgi:23S rRNA pseudouridine1911/1915/1917 synthase
LHQAEALIMSKRIRRTPSRSIEVLYEDNHLLVVNKPAGIATMGVATNTASLLTQAKEYVKHKYQKPGNVYLGIVSRLDAPVTGIVLMARTSKAARRLTQQFRAQCVRKTYWAVIDSPLDPPAATCVDWLRHDERHRRVCISSSADPGAKQARLRYWTIQSLGTARLLEIELETGRKHQIRVQLAHRRRPILGDRKYGSTREFPGGIALHARRLELEHPVRHCPLEFVAPLPESWSALKIKLPSSRYPG